MRTLKFHQLINLFISLLITVLAGTNTAVAGGIGAGTFAYPSKGQSDEQIQQDKLYCHDWAIKESGYDPNRPPPPPQSYAYAPPPSSSGVFGGGEAGQGGVVRDGARGAALGAIGGAIAGDAGKGAAIGALSGALLGGVKRSSRREEEQRWQQQQYQQQAQQQQAYQQQVSAATDVYRRGYAVCMSSRGYNVQ